MPNEYFSQFVVSGYADDVSRAAVAAPRRMVRHEISKAKAGHVARPAALQGKTKVIAGVVVEDDGKWLSYPLDRVDLTDEQWDRINPGISQDLSHYNWD